MKRAITVFAVLLFLLFGVVSAGAAEEGRRLEPAELTALTEGLPFEENGFFLSTYDRPEEIDWHQVFYNGAGLSVEPDEALLRAYESRYGELWTSLEAIPDSVISDYVWEKTRTSYAEARRPLALTWTYLPECDMWGYAHGDTNYEPIEFTDGWVNDGEYRLIYTRSDWESYSERREFVMTASIRDGRWQYISNLPADAPAPVTLLDIEFFDSRESVERTRSVSDFIEATPRAYDDPDGWCWAVMTARTDDVRFIVDRVTSAFDLGWDGAMMPDENIASGVLRDGESVALYVNRPWYPSVIVTASKGAYWGEYCFGEDNGLGLDETAKRYVTGHDLTGEGRGCDPRNLSELERFLTDGVWVWCDAYTGEILATVSFPDPWQMDITTVDEAYPIYLRYGYVYAGEDEAPDLLMLERGAYYDTSWTPLPDWYTSDSLGDYLIYAIQLDGEQLLYLTQANNGEGALGYLLPNAGEDTHEFMLRRFRGTEDYEGQGGEEGWYEVTIEPYLVRAGDPPTPYYAGPGYEYEISGWIEEAGVFTIVEEYWNDELWGRLKSGAGWLCLSDVEYY